MVIEKILKIITVSVILSLLVLLIYLAANKFIYEAGVSNAELKSNEIFTGKDDAQETNQQFSSTIDKTDSEIPLILNTKSISDQINKERITRARESYEKGTKREKIQALHLLMHVSPVDASIILHELLAGSEKTPESLGFIRHLMAGLSEEEAYLQDSDIKLIYTLNDPVAQKIAAIILENRGDSSLVNDFMQSKESSLNSKDSNERRLALQEIGAVGFTAANTYFINALKDSNPNIRLQAIKHLRVFGNHTSITDIEMLFQDANDVVVEKARDAVQSLWNKDEFEELPLNRRLMQPGFPVNGLLPD